MLFQDEEPTEAQLLQRERTAKFAPQAADRIKAAEDCLFSLLPVEEALAPGRGLVRRMFAGHAARELRAD